MFLKHNQFTVAMIAVIFSLCLLPGNEVPSSNQIHLDKFVHFVLFALLSFCALIGFKKQYQVDLLSQYPGVMTIAMGASYGVIIELFQGLYLPDRAFEVMDILADWSGTIVGYFAAHLLTRTSSKKTGELFGD